MVNGDDVPMTLQKWDYRRRAIQSALDVIDGNIVDKYSVVGIVLREKETGQFLTVKREQIDKGEINLWELA